MSSEITIEGLTLRQKFFADILWEIQSREKVNEFIHSLPTIELQDEARLVKDLLLFAALDQFCDDRGDLGQVQELLKRISDR